MSVAPSPATIEPEYAPSWALPLKSQTEDDLVAQGLRECATPYVDLRPVLRAAKAQPRRLYRLTDSHWTQYGSMLAYNAIVEGLGKASWRIDPEGFAWTTVTSTDGDLPRLAGREPMPESVEVSSLTNLPAGAIREPLAGVETGPTHAPSFSVKTGRSGPTVVIIGDSYSTYLPSYLAPHVGTIIWAHHDGCGFDWRVLTQFKADYVVMIPVSRYAGCREGTRPSHFSS